MSVENLKPISLSPNEARIEAFLTRYEKELPGVLGDKVSVDIALDDMNIGSSNEI